MDVSGLLSIEQKSKGAIPVYKSAASDQPVDQPHNIQKMQRDIMDERDDGRLKTASNVYSEGRLDSYMPHDPQLSPSEIRPRKSVTFELLFPESPQFRARLPLRVFIYPHDTTESIVTTVKNFYGLYAGPGVAKCVSFEDDHGNILIARYENLADNMVVYVRVRDQLSHSPGTYNPSPHHFESPVQLPGYTAIAPYNMLPPPAAQALTYGQSPPRPDSRTSRSRSRTGQKSRDGSLNGYSSGDGAPGSVSSRTKSEHILNTDISVENIVEGGRRKRAKFESSELPLFAPPQMPAASSNSSISPARRMSHGRAMYPLQQPSHNPFHSPQIIQSPQNHRNEFGQPGIYSTPASEGRRLRGSDAFPSRQSVGQPGSGRILPTPDPTVGSCMSEEDKDVALQLMRLGEMINVSHGRTSASTLDDTFSGKADAASSTGASSDEDSESEDELPPSQRQKLEGGLYNGSSAAKPKIFTSISRQNTDSYENDSENEERILKLEPQDSGLDLDGIAQAKTGNIRTLSQGAKSSKLIKSGRVAKPGQAVKKQKLGATIPSSKAPVSPTSLPPHSRKASVSSAINFQHQLGDDEEDLSSKPRCQRCRKSKKGCDRQRPCQRCKDAGLSADQCISEDEGNGRKGRYGRHMGVPVKKDDIAATAGFVSTVWPAGTAGTADKSKKRKR